RKASSKATLSSAIFTAGRSILRTAPLLGRRAWFRSGLIPRSSKTGRSLSRCEQRFRASDEGASRHSPDRKIKILIRGRLVVSREAPPLLVVGPKTAVDHRRGEDGAG